MIGGAPITNDFAKEIGAGAYGKDAGTAVAQPRRICPVWPDDIHLQQRSPATEL